jgi:hypothetical protein
LNTVRRSESRHDHRIWLNTRFLEAFKAGDYHCKVSARGTRTIDSERSRVDARMSSPCPGWDVDNGWSVVFSTTIWTGIGWNRSWVGLSRRGLHLSFPVTILEGRSAAWCNWRVSKAMTVRLQHLMRLVGQGHHF